MTERALIDMAEESEKKPSKSKPRRPKDIIAAEKRAWLAKHEWAGVRDAIELVADAAKAVEEAQAGAAGKAAAVDFKPAANTLTALREKLSILLPPEAR